jgi:formamidopyrimidine-DNA glycosylase
LAGRVITAVKLLRPEIAHGPQKPSNALLRGRQIKEVVRVGKQVKIALSGEMCLRVHLGMTGRMTVTSAASPVEKHTHLRVSFKGEALEMRFCDPRRFGGLWLLDAKCDETKGWVGRRLPPVAADPLQMSLAEWRECLARRRQIKSLLLAQDPISGVGNIYCDEALHRAGIHPLARANELKPDAVRRLYRALRQVLNESIAAGGSSVSDYRDAEGTKGWFQVWHRVYGCAGKPCRQCKTPIKKFVVAGRGTHICPRCQKLR